MPCYNRDSRKDHNFDNHPDKLEMTLDTLVRSDEGEDFAEVSGLEASEEPWL